MPHEITPADVALWRKGFDDLLDKARRLFEPKIIVWGPGKTNPKGFDKRGKIKERIIEENPNASVIIPEDPDVISFTRQYVSDIEKQELLQALTSDLIFALDISQGAGEEVASLSRMRGVAGKLFVLTYESRRRGYGEVVRRNLHVECFSEADFQHCDRASSYCQEQVRAWLIEQAANRGL